MSKQNIPICKLPDEECNILFKSVVEKLKIENPTFFYPIYKKLTNDTSNNPEELQNFVFDSKYKCKEIIEKLVDSDDEMFDTDDEEQEQDLENPARKAAFEKSRAKTQEKEQGSGSDNGSNNGSDNNSDPEDTEVNKDIENILNGDIKDIPIEDENNFEDTDLNIYDNYDNKEIEEAINNTYMATAIIEKLNKVTGEKVFKEEIIHIKKTALLDPLKVMKDEFVIPGKIQNKNISDETLKNTMNKLNSYNNCGHVESLFLYLGNKLVETGKCPSFPYYYGCVNGEDPNYHHNITDEYDTVSRTRWFKDRVKTDFDLLIIEDDDDDDSETSNSNKNIRRPSNCSNTSSASNGSELNDKDETKNEAKTEVECNENLTEETNISTPKIIDLNFIKDMDLEDLDINMDFNENENETSTDLEFDIDSDSDSLQIQDGGEKADGDCIKDKTKCKNKTCSENCSETCRETCNDNDDNDNDNDEDDEKSNYCSDDDFIEELSDIEDNLSITDFEDKPGNMYYIKCEKMPVSLSLMEKLDDTLDNVLDNDYIMSETEWFGMFFQVAFGLAVAQKYFSFVHNDLHSSNVMFKKTLLKHLYFQVDNNYYRIPTYGKITKIIDFARGTFKFGDRWVFSDQFKEDGDAHGQYDYPVDGNLKNCEHKPNPSFDLVRLGTTVIQRLEDLPNVREFVEQITLDDNDTSLCYDEDTFDLYIDIARNCHNAVPIEVMARKEFERFKINKNKIPKGQYIFKY